jgi:ubiquitin C-terminal hydrolase
MKWVDFSVDLEMGREVLSVASKTKYTLKQRQYKLFAVVYHNGREATKGHYVTDIYHTGQLLTLYPAGGDSPMTLVIRLTKFAGD